MQKQCHFWKNTILLHKNGESRNEKIFLLQIYNIVAEIKSHKF